MYNYQMTEKLMKEKWFHELFIAYGNKLSEKKIKELLKNYKEDYKKLDSNVDFVIEHLKKYPSEKRFNIFNNCFNFQQYSNETKAKLIASCFMLGRDKIFKRSLQILLNDDVVDKLPEALIDASRRNDKYNCLTRNCKIMKDILSNHSGYPEVEKSMGDVIASYYFGFSGGNINSLFCPHVNFTEKQEKSIYNKFNNCMIYGHYNKIIFDNDFKDYYKRNITKDKSNEYILKMIDDEDRNKKTESFLKFLKGEGYFFEIFPSLKEIRQLKEYLFEDKSKNYNFMISQFSLLSKFFTDEQFESIFSEHIFADLEHGTPFEQKTYKNLVINMLAKRADIKLPENNEISVEEMLELYKIVQEKKEIIHATFKEEDFRSKAISHHKRI